MEAKRDTLTVNQVQHTDQILKNQIKVIEKDNQILNAMIEETDLEDDDFWTRMNSTMAKVKQTQSDLKQCYAKGQKVE